MDLFRNREIPDPADQEIRLEGLAARRASCLLLATRAVAARFLRLAQYLEREFPRTTADFAPDLGNKVDVFQESSSDKK